MKKLFATAVLSLAVSAVSPVIAAESADSLGGKTAMCIGCHNIRGYQASFPQVHKVPMISGQNAKYIAAALTAYRKGDRKHPTMRAVAGSLTDADIDALAAFYERQGGPAQAAGGKSHEPSTQVAELLKKANCASCHGENFSKPVDPSYPKLAGQHADYLFVALKSYRVENNPQVGRNNAIMAGMAKLYTPAELKLMADYLGSLEGDLKVVPQSPLR